MKIQRKSLFLFWAWMDLFFVLQFLWWNIAHRRLPFTTICWLISSCCTPGLRGGLAVPAECSADYQHPAIDDLFPPEPLCAVAGLGQAPLRLLFMQPSLSLGLWLIQAAGVRHVAILAGFLLLSEGLKIASLWYCRGGIQGIKR